jgi:hypothetical protein
MIDGAGRPKSLRLPASPCCLLTCKYLVNMKGTRCPRCSASEEGPCINIVNVRTSRQHYHDRPHASACKCADVGFCSMQSTIDSDGMGVDARRGCHATFHSTRAAKDARGHVHLQASCEERIRMWQDRARLLGSTIKLVSHRHHWPGHGRCRERSCIPACSTLA